MRENKAHKEKDEENKNRGVKIKQIEELGKHNQLAIEQMHNPPQKYALSLLLLSKKKRQNRKSKMPSMCLYSKFIDEFLINCYN